MPRDNVNSILISVANDGRDDLARRLVEAAEGLGVPVLELMAILSSAGHLETVRYIRESLLPRPGVRGFDYSGLSSHQT